MKKTILKAALTALIVAVPVAVFAGNGLQGDCYDCHTMHNLENGLPVVSDGPVHNLLKYDCISCHANDPASGQAFFTLSGGSAIPQVAHGQGMNGLAGGNFSLGLGDSSKVHNVNDLFTGQWDTNAGDINDTVEWGAPPGTAPAAHYHGLSRAVFTTDIATPFDAFTCAGARGCHGTRSQLLSGETVDNGTANNFSGVRRTGMAAISGAHHNFTDGAKTSTGYNLAAAETAYHDGQTVADGYRFIPGLFGYGNLDDPYKNNDGGSHNEYYGNPDGLGDGCGSCHIEGHNGGYNTRAAINSTLKTPNNSMSGFCATCHGMFHSAGGVGTVDTVDYTDNGVSGAFLRHPSDYAIPNSSEYQNYTTYDVTAPVARASVTGLTTSSNDVTPGGGDMVMCLSCHYAHGSDQDFLLRFDYTAMTAGSYASIGDAQNAGGCLACHTEKGVDPADR